MSNKVKQELGKIEIPKELHDRSKIGIRKASYEFKGRGKMNKFLKGLGVAAAVAILSISLLATVNPGFASSLQGFFKDIANWQGVVTGTEYNQATEEIDVKIAEPLVKNNHFVLPITVTFEEAEKAPYNVAEALTFGEFKVISHNEVEITEEQIQVEPVSKEDFNFEIGDSHKLLTEIENNNPNIRVFQANLVIDKKLLNSNDKFILIINSFFEHKKADAPLEVKGEWQLEFLTK